MNYLSENDLSQPKLHLSIPNYTNATIPRHSFATFNTSSVASLLVGQQPNLLEAYSSVQKWIMVT